MDGATTSKASAGSPPWDAGSVNNGMSLYISQNVLGQPWVMSSGMGLGPWPRTCTKCKSFWPSTSAVNWGSSFSRRSCSRQSNSLSQ